MLTGSSNKYIEKLRRLLLDLKPTGDDGFEGLLATTLSEFSGLTIRLAKSGSQFGRDGRSPSGSFAIAMEAKRYTDDLGLEVLAKAAVAGHVLDDTVDLWALGATSAIGDDTVEKLTGLLEDRGVTFLALDWPASQLPPMAVLLSATRNTSIDWLRKRAGCDRPTLTKIFSAIAEHRSYNAQADRLRDEITSAKVGLGSLRIRSDDWLSRRLREPLASQNAFGQYLTVAGSDWPAVRRPVYLERLTQITKLSNCERPVVAAVLGPEGVGKSWLIANWWNALGERPIMLIVSGGRVERLRPNEPLESIAHLLSDQVPCGSHDSAGGWLRRLRRWKKQGATGDLRFVITIDGVNERPTRPWADLIKGLAEEAHMLGGLIAVSSRNAFWNRDIRPRLPDSLDIRTMELDGFDHEETKMALARVGVSPETLPEKVREFVRNPRICALAVKLLDRLLQPGELTVDRLLFEYWRHRLEERGDLTKHTIADFEKLIRSHAREWLERPSRSFDRDEWHSHSGAAQRLGLDHVLNDVSDIEEGRFLQISSDDSETYEFRSEALPYAFALLVNHELKSSKTGEPPYEQLHRILDPIRGFDIAAEVVAACVRLACLDSSFPEQARTALVRAWMGSQNVNYDASDTMAAYVRACPAPFLRAAEIATDPTQPFIHGDLLLALLMSSRDTDRVRSAVSQCIPRWLAQWSRKLRVTFADESDAKLQSERGSSIDARLASMTPEEMAFFRQITFEESDSPTIALTASAPMLMAGRPLAPHAKGILGWAFARTIAGDLSDTFDSLAWVVRLNPVDSIATHDALRLLLQDVDVSGSECVRRAAAAVLRLLGTRQSAREAEEIYATAPSTKWRRIERFCDTNPYDPSAQPGSNLDHARSAAKAIDPVGVWSSGSVTVQDADLEGVTAPLARFDPIPVVELLRSILCTAPARTGGAIRSLSWRLVELSPLFDQNTIDAVRAGYHQILRNAAEDTPDHGHVACSFARSLMPHLSSEEQLDLLLTLPADIQQRLTLRDSVRPLPAKIFEERLEVAVAESDPGVLRGILFFAAGAKPELSSRSRSIMAFCLSHPDPVVRACASECVYQAQDGELDRVMLSSDRVPKTAETEFLEQYRDGAEVRAIIDSRHVDLLHRVSPRLLGLVAQELSGEALTLFSDYIDRVISTLLRSINLLPPAEVQISIPVAENALPTRYRVTDKNFGGKPTDLQKFIAEINDPESARRRLSERQRDMNKTAAAYMERVSRNDAAEFGRNPPRCGLKQVLRLDLTRIGSWINRLLAVQDLQVKRQVCNLAVSLASVYSSHDPVLSTRVFQHFYDCHPFINVQVGPEQIPLYEFELFSSEDSAELETLKSLVFAQALNDSDLHQATIAAEVCGAHAWLERYLHRLMESSHPADQARSLTILGFRQPNGMSERILSGATEPGFLGQVKAFARKNYRRAAWTNHWLERLEQANGPIDFWRYGNLAEAICDLRFVRVFPNAIADDTLHVFSSDLYRRMEEKAKERSRRLIDSLFGLRAPDTALADAIYDRPPSSEYD